MSAVVPYIEGAAAAYSAYETGRAMYRGYKRARRAVSRERHAQSESVTNRIQSISAGPSARARRKRAYRQRKRISNRLKSMAIRTVFPLNTELANREFRALSEMELGRGRMICGNMFHDATHKFYTLPCHLYYCTYMPGWDTLDFSNRPLSLCYAITTNGAPDRNYRWTTRTPHYTNAGGGDDIDVAQNVEPNTGINTVVLAPSSSSPAFKLSSVGATMNDLKIRRYHYCRDIVADLVLYGQTNRPTHWRIDVVSFKNEDMMAAATSQWATWTGTTGGAFGNGSAEQNVLGEALIKRYTMNPLVETESIGRYLKVHKTWTVDIAEGKSDGADGAVDQIPRVRTRLRYVVNKPMTAFYRRWTTFNYATADDHYDPEKGTGGVLTSKATNGTMLDPVDSGGALTSDNGHPIYRTDRLFFMIRATDPDSKQEDSFAVGTKPTYDIKLRTRWMTQASSISPNQI